MNKQSEFRIPVFLAAYLPLLFLVTDIPYSLVPESGDDCSRRIGGPVIHNQNFEIMKGLIEDAGNRDRQIIRAIVGRYDDANSWHGSSVLAQDRHAEVLGLPSGACIGQVRAAKGNSNSLGVRSMPSIWRTKVLVCKQPFIELHKAVIEQFQVVVFLHIISSPAT